MRYILPSLAALALLPVAQAASFDCTQATAPIEKQICASPAVSKLDDQLASTYEDALETADNPVELKKNQIGWLKAMRKTCRDTACLEASYKKRLGKLKALKPAPWKTFRNEALGVQFSYPGNQTIAVDLKQKTITTRGYRFEQGPNTMSVGDILVLQVGDGDLERGLKASEHFEKHKGQWAITTDGALDGKVSYAPATKFAGEGWQGFRGTYGCGTSRQWDCGIAVLSNGKRYLVISPDNGGDFGEREQKILSSIRLH